MVVALGPGNFYGSSLPRPWIYTDVKLSNDGIRVDPPLSILDPLLTWANDAHWSMGGLSFKRHRLQGRIEGSVKKLRAQQERSFKKKKKEDMNKKPISSSVPTFLSLLSDDESGEESEEEVVRSPLRKRPVRKLGDDFDRSASANAARKVKSKGSGNDSPVSVENIKGSPMKKKSKKNKPTTDPVIHSSPLTRRRRALLLNDDDPEEEPESSQGRLQKHRRRSTNEKINGSSPLSASLDGVASRTRNRKSVTNRRN